MKTLKSLFGVCNLSFVHFSDDSLSSSVSQFFIIRMCFPCHYRSALSTLLAIFLFISVA